MKIFFNTFDGQRIQSPDYDIKKPNDLRANEYFAESQGILYSVIRTFGGTTVGNEELYITERFYLIDQPANSFTRNEDGLFELLVN
jgi:hypothetical protein